MKKLLWLLLIPLVATGAYIIGSWQNVGNSLQRSNDGLNFRTDLGSGRGFAYWYQSTQIDSLFLNAHTWPLSDSLTNKVATLQYVNNLQNHNAIFLSPLYFGHTGTSLDPITVNNSDSLGHVGASAYSLISGTNTLRTAANFGQTASEADVAHYDIPAGPANTYTISGWLHIASGAGYSITMKVTFVYGGVTFTQYFFPIVDGSTTLPTSAVLTTVDFYSFLPVHVRADPSTTIQVSTTLSAGTILYEDGATIELKK